jgi:hypothetical protein
MIPERGSSGFTLMTARTVRGMTLQIHPVPNPVTPIMNRSHSKVWSRAKFF